ncbi:MAG: hypothetical protein KDA51_09125 [Planctomycetales bacterium]|nr:hypothetical protein [Planctomycetales bacterium]MCA9181605.1 hypothetical protein [Planctomycetales bacterium]MCA9209350.1 hypothetical protein [Planctomycetales bacterium]MCA9225729.1 hypothetical protein [Planctomycetales bacterium]
MSHDPHSLQAMFRIDVSAESAQPTPSDENSLMIALLRQMIFNQDRTNKLLEQLVEQTGAIQKQRATELGQWKEQNPDLARRCRKAAETLARVQNEFLTSLTEEVLDNEDCLMDGEFMLNEFVDRFGPRMAHLNGVLQVLSQLSSMPSTPSNASS